MSALRYVIDQGVGVIELDTPGEPVNTISAALIEELDRKSVV